MSPLPQTEVGTNRKKEEIITREVKFQDLQMNPNTLIANEWMLVTAGNQERGYNTMTASWGHLGSIWGHNGGLPTAVAYLRPQRYTDEFVNREDYFTLTFFPSEYKKALGYLGTRSGRDEQATMTTLAGLVVVLMMIVLPVWGVVLGIVAVEGAINKRRRQKDS